MLRILGVRRNWLLAAGLGLVLAACGPGYAPAGVVVVPRRPPEVRVEIRDQSPGPRYVWVPGHHAWRNNDYVWISGAWSLPPEDRFRRWEPGHWVSTRGGWYWVEGRWR